MGIQLTLQSGNELTATEDYLLGAVSGAVDGCGADRATERYVVFLIPLGTLQIGHGPIFGSLP